MSPVLHPLRRNLSFLILLHLGFVLVGIATTLLGVILPVLGVRFGLTDAESGSLFTIQFAGALIGTLFSSRLWTRIGFLPVLVAGFLSMSLGIFGLVSGELNLIRFCIFLNGIGIGLTIPVINLLITILFAEKAAAALNILNFAWGCGAMLCPLFVGLPGNSINIRAPLICFGFFLLINSLLFLAFTKFSISFSDLPAKSDSQSSQNVWRTPFASLTAAFFFVYVGTENSLSGWLTVYSLRLQNAENLSWLPTATVFWAAFMLGRVFAPFFLRRIEEKNFMLIALLTSLCGAALLLASTHISLVTFAAALAGLGLAPLFPLALAQFTNHLGEAGVRSANWLFIFGTLGGAIFTWLVGFLSNVFGDLRSGLFITLVCGVLLFFLQILLSVKVKKH